MNSNKINRILLIAIVLTLAAMGLYHVIPAKKYSVVPSKYWRQEFFMAYNDDQIEVSEPLGSDPYTLRCKITDVTQNILCGLNFYFGYDIPEGVDFSSYEKIRIKATYLGKAPKVLLFIRNYNPAFSLPNDANSAKYMSLHLAKSEFSDSSIEIHLNEFSVPDWWLNQRSLERRLTVPEFHNVTTLGFDFGWFLQPNDDIQMRIESIVFEGVWIPQKFWYLGIMAFWIFTILAFVTYKYIVTLRERLFFEGESRMYQKLSNIDVLTGALNRAGIEKNLERLLAGHRSKGIGLMIVDIDHFKRINDHRGHDAGDRVLKSFVAIISSHLRSKDVLGRWGGEEFVLILSDIDINILFRVAEKLRELIASHVFLEEYPLKVTASFGVAMIGKNESFEATLKRADEALYSAKNSGRNCTIIASETIKDQTLKNM